MIWICAYRDYYQKVYEEIKLHHECRLIKSKHELNAKYHTEFCKGDVVFFVGWSWKVEKNIIDDYECICMHPSPLPKYRGGSPLQHQIINGETMSAVTFFRMTNKIDKGNILAHYEFSLAGSLKQVINRIIPLSITGIFHILNNDIEELEQDESIATIYKRRKPIESEILKSDLEQFTSKEIHNKIRCLQDPYPNAFIVCKDGTRLYIKDTEYEN
jgi:methionyl-tRNA formyltransferase